MKKHIFLMIFALFSSFLTPLLPENAVFAENEAASEGAKMVIIIDDFGGWDQSGVETMLSIDAPLTCAVIPSADNTEKNCREILAANKELIVHVPMQAHVNLPLNWYGEFYIGVSDSKGEVYKKLDRAFESVKGARGFNIHIGSGVCQNLETMKSIYSYAKEKGLPFVDSRTHINTKGEQAAREVGVKYLGRDEFLEPEGDRSYEGAVRHLMVGANKAKETGFSIVIGHVGSHGGENTARAIRDSVEKIRAMGVEIIPLSEVKIKEA